MSRLLKSLVLAACTLAPLAAHAQNRKPLRQAEDAVNEALKAAQRSGPGCRSTMQSRLESLARDVRSLGNDADFMDVQRVERAVANAAASAGFASCPDGVMNALYRADDALNDVRTSRWDNNNRPGRDDDDERSRFGEMKQLQVQANVQFDGESAVRVSVPELTLRNMRGQNFYLGARFKSLQGNWSEWTTTQTWSVPSDPFVWRNAFTHYFLGSTLAEDDFANGRFIAQVSVFDARGRAVVTREVQFRANLPQLPPPGPGPGFPPPMAQRECGTGPDVGCTMTRDGRLPMDGTTFQGFMGSMQSNPNELMRQDIANTMFKTQYVTALQYGLVLDLFRNEITRMDIAKMGGRKLVNPQHALAYAAKFNNSIYQRDFTQFISQQLNQQQPLPPPPPGGPGYQVRDCGTGPNDPGCSMQRNGRWAMDAPTWSNIYTALRTQQNEYMRRDMINQLTGNQMMTAMQLGLLMDLLDNEYMRRDFANAAAPRVVNPMHALSLSSKFSNSYFQRDFVTLMSQQK
ncbi:MAG: hypothetical protein ACO1OB_21435 [Archangium sp.]